MILSNKDNYSLIRTLEPPLGAVTRRFFIALMLRVGHCTFPRFFALTASVLLVSLLPYNNAHAANAFAFDCEKIEYSLRLEAGGIAVDTGSRFKLDGTRLVTTGV